MLSAILLEDKCNLALVQNNEKSKTTHDFKSSQYKILLQLPLYDCNINNVKQEVHQL